MPTMISNCPLCKGTGLRPKDAIAIMCGWCNGTGQHKFDYEEFKGKVKLHGIKRVYPVDYGTDNSNYGCTYDEWLEGKFPKHNRDLYCPAVLEGYYRDKCIKYLPDYSRDFTTCALFENKHVCWKEYYDFKFVQGS